MCVHMLFIRVNLFLIEDRRARKITDDHELFPLYEMADIFQLKSVLVDTVTTNSIELMMFLLRNVFQSLL